MSAKHEVEAFKRRLLAEKLALCTEPQRALFARCYPKGVPSDSLESAIDLCDRTIKKNEATVASVNTKTGAGLQRCVELVADVRDCATRAKGLGFSVHEEWLTKVASEIESRVRRDGPPAEAYVEIGETL